MIAPGPAGRWLLFLSAVFPAALFVSTQTIASAVLPLMQGDLSAGLDQISWVITASVVAGAIGIPPTRWLAARFGRRRVMVATMLGLGIGGVLVGLAPNLQAVVWWRAVAAFCAAPVVALSQAVTLDLFPPREQPRAFAYWAVCILSGWVFAPALGAFVAEDHGWRILFLLIGPIGAIGALSAAFVPDGEREPPTRFDWVGFITLSLGVAGVLVVLNRGERLGWFESEAIVAWGALGALGLYLFAVHASTSENPFVRWSVFRDRNFAIGVPVIFIYASLSLAPLVVIPAMLRTIKGLELLTTGLALVPRGLSQIAALLVIGSIVSRFDPRLLMVVGFVMFALSGFHMASYSAELGLADLLIPNVVQGAAMALIWAPLAGLVYANLPPRLRTDGTTIVSLLYSLASSIGVAASIAILSRSAQVSRGSLVGHVAETNEATRLVAHQGRWDLGDLQALRGIEAIVDREALMIGYINVFWVMSACALAVIPLVLLMVRTRE